MDVDIIITCEHAGNDIPESYRHLFPADAVGVLASHRGWDPGAWEVAMYLADRLAVPLYGCHTSRLLIEVNRSLHHPELFSEFTASLAIEDKKTLIENVYRPYRDAVMERMRRGQGHVLHFSLHSFTPVLHGHVRAMEIGLLFDPASPLEAACCDLMRNSLQESLPTISIAFNEPYKGVDDGFTASLRGAFPSGTYAGIEIEVNQKLMGTRLWGEMEEALVDSVRDLHDLPANP